MLVEEYPRCGGPRTGQTDPEPDIGVRGLSSAKEGVAEEEGAAGEGE